MPTSNSCWGLVTFSHLEGPPALRVDIFKIKNSKYIKCQNDDEMEIVEDLILCAEPSQPLVKNHDGAEKAWNSFDIRLGYILSSREQGSKEEWIHLWTRIERITCVIISLINSKQSNLWNWMEIIYLLAYSLMTTHSYYPFSGLHLHSLYERWCTRDFILFF